MRHTRSDAASSCSQGVRAAANVDLYNVFNSNDVTAENHQYGTNGAAWLTPIAIVGGRLFKLSVQTDF